MIPAAIAPCDAAVPDVPGRARDTAPTPRTDACTPPRVTVLLGKFAHVRDRVEIEPDRMLRPLPTFGHSRLHHCLRILAAQVAIAPAVAPSHPPIEVQGRATHQ